MTAGNDLKNLITLFIRYRIHGNYLCYSTMLTSGNAFIEHFNLPRQIFENAQRTFIQICRDLNLVSQVQESYEIDDVTECMARGFLHRVYYGDGKDFEYSNLYRDLDSVAQASGK